MKHNICIVSDFFYPGFGGVEIHIFNISQCLVRLGHKVVIVTRCYDGSRQGVRWLTRGVKVYYLPLLAVKLPPGTVTLPTVLGLLPYVRNIFIRERITLVHGHQTTSNMCHETMFHAGTMGIPTVFTDHSLFGFADLASIHINKVLEWSLLTVGHTICVSHTCRENTVLRAKIPPHKVSVIPNATDPQKFTPSPDIDKSATWNDIFKKNPQITIVVITRLVYRKGADLLADVVPAVCKKYPGIRWIIGGDGPRKLQMEQMVERNNLHSCVELLGEVQDVASVLRKGQIFVNTSLTEAFCIAIIEAASCGHLVVSTRVGGVPEVMPPDMLILAEPEPSSITSCIDAAISRVGAVHPWDHHSRVSEMYNWNNVAERTLQVYAKACKNPPLPVSARIQRALSLGICYGIITAGLVALDHLFWLFLKFFRPASGVQVARDYNFKPPDDPRL
eukprot:TRINITY_DN8772_c0_g1_i1.p1 TRINITY_DN8772_c0_g1~~TRINITY_DN8772_c0_g1_i1.p1  ORF type:complete len:447 (+),score=31.84 TRINITY_DN8772_c0_g1_i1:110-1450(+)